MPANDAQHSANSATKLRSPVRRTAVSSANVILGTVSVLHHLQEVLVGESGILATTTDEWVAAIRRLADPELRQQLGSAGRRQVEDEFSVEAGARRWVAALDRLAARKVG